MYKQHHADRIAGWFLQLMRAIPFLDPSDPLLKGTPERVGQMYAELFWGLDPTKRPRFTTFPANGNYGMVGTGKIFFASTCAHHFLPFAGHVRIFYIPDKLILGLSKFSRLVSWLAARPQLQEQLTAQIADAIMDITKPKGCYVTIESTHSCVQCRGVKQERAVMTTSVIRPTNEIGMPIGPFEKAQTRMEALAQMER